MANAKYFSTYFDYLDRFQLYYYANGEFKKDERKDTILTIDTRFIDSFQIFLYMGHPQKCDQ